MKNAMLPLLLASLQIFTVQAVANHGGSFGAPSRQIGLCTYPAATGSERVSYPLIPVVGSEEESAYPERGTIAVVMPLDQTRKLRFWWFQDRLQISVELRDLSGDKVAVDTYLPIVRVPLNGKSPEEKRTEIAWLLKKYQVRLNYDRKNHVECEVTPILE